MTRAVSTMAVGAGISTGPDSRSAAYDAALEAMSGLGAGDVDLAFLFLSPEHLDDAAAAADAVREALEPRRLVGCVAGGVLARDRELETGPAAAVWAARLPGAEIECFHASAEQANGDAIVTGFPPLAHAEAVTLLADPFSFPVAPVLDDLNERFPGLPVVGGIATGGGRAGAQALVLDDEVHTEGAVGVVIKGVRVVTIVSQGCAPVGPESVVTRAEGNVVFELAGRPALDRLREILAGLSPAEQHLAAQGLLAGLVIDENKADYGRGDYLMRGVLGADEESGAVAIGAPVRVGQTVRFHVRDADSADDDLRDALGTGLEAARGALLFTCNGRGTQMFASPDHDARLARDALGTDGLAGFFCGGEIGPVGGRTFLHGFTATLAVFVDAP